MDNTIVVAIVSGLSVAIPNLIATFSNNKKNQELINYKIGELTEHVNKHNNLIDRMYKVENRVTLLEEERQ